MTALLICICLAAGIGWIWDILFDEKYKRRD